MEAFYLVESPRRLGSCPVVGQQTSGADTIDPSSPALAGSSQQLPSVDNQNTLSMNKLINQYRHILYTDLVPKIRASWKNNWTEPRDIWIRTVIKLLFIMAEPSLHPSKGHSSGSRVHPLTEVIPAILNNTI